jgi:hypothetical protein
MTMPRPEIHVDPATGPVAQFAHELRELRNRAGRPSYREMGAKVFVSYSSLSRAAAGHRLPTWPVVHGFVMACGGDPDEWHARWLAARDAAEALPDPASIETVAHLRGAVRDILKRHDLGVISAAMREPLSVVRQLSRWPEQVELSMFERFIKACGASEEVTLEWTAAWRKVVGPDDVAPPVSAVPDWVPAAVPAPATMANYDVMLSALQTLRDAGGVSPRDIERITEGRLRAQRAAAILAGVQPANGEEFVLLLRALGVREGVDQWIDSWLRVNGVALGRNLLPRKVRLPTRQVASTLVVVLLGLSVVLVASSYGF